MKNLITNLELNKINTFCSKNAFWIGLIIIILLYIPYLLFKESSVIGRSWDYLDSNVVWIKTMVESGNIFSKNSTIIPNIMNQPRVSYGNEFDMIVLWEYILPTFWALVLNSFLIAVTAFFSMWTLIKFQIKLNPIFNAMISLSFALLPFWQHGGIGIAGAPYIIYLFIKLLKYKSFNYRDYIFLIIYPFYSSFFVLTMFLYGEIFILLLIIWISYKKKFNIKCFYLLGYLFLMSVLINYRYIVEAIYPSFAVSNRTVMQNNGILVEFNVAYYIFKDVFIKGHAHSNSFHFFILVAFSIYMIINLFKKLSYRKEIFILISIIFINCLFFIYFSSLFTKFTNILNVKIFNGMTLDRFVLLNPILWYFLFAYIIDAWIKSYRRWLVLLAFIFVSLQLAYTLRKSIVYYNVFHSLISFKDYYMFDEFKIINQKLPQPKSNYRVICYGFEPAIVNYNGYYSTDGFFAYFDLKYKHQFKQVVQPILNENKRLDNYYSYLLCHNYIFVDNYLPGSLSGQIYSKTPKKLVLNKSFLKQNNTQYLLSTIPISNTDEYKLLFKVPSSHWEYIYIYQIMYGNF